MRPIAIIAALALAACVNPELADPNSIVVTNDADGLSGRYNPAGWDAEGARAEIAANCPSGRIARFATTEQPNGLVAFEARCAA